MIAVVIVAGGIGRRFKSGFNKIFAEICGRPIISHTIQNFESCPDLNSIVITAGNPKDQTAEQDCKLVREMIAKEGFRKVKAVVAGGPTRMQSVGEGLKAIPLKDDDFVLIQDAARPFTPPALISQIITAAKEHGAAICGTTPKDTIQKKDADGFATETFDRNHLVAVFTPVAVRWGLLKRAREKAVREKTLDTPGFEDSAILQLAGIKVKIVPCDDTNLKITTPEDLLLAEQILKC